MTAVQAALSGVLVGGLYALMAAGLSVTWGVLRVINLAHFGMILLGAYLTFETATSWGIDPILTLAVTVPLMAVLGAALQQCFDRFRLVEFKSLLLSFGVLIVVIQVASNIWSADFRRMPAGVNPYATHSVALGPFVFPTPTLLAFGFAIVLLGAAHLALQQTFTGRAMRAIAEDRDVAASFGVDPRRLDMMLSAAAGGSAAVAGMLFALGNAVTPSTAFEWFGIVFAVAILGGIGHVLGTLTAGVLIGVLSAVAAVVWSPAFSPFVVYAAIVVAILLRPQGLFAPRGAR